MPTEKYFYLRSRKGKVYNHKKQCNMHVGNAPLVTVCLLEDGNKVARGMAVCSSNINHDNPDKKKGKRLAKNYALRALGTERTSVDMTEKTLEHQRILKPKYYKTFARLGREEKEVFKKIRFQSEFLPQLSPFEHKLLKSARP